VGLELTIRSHNCLTHYGESWTPASEKRSTAIGTTNLQKMWNAEASATRTIICVESGQAATLQRNLQEIGDAWYGVMS